MKQNKGISLIVLVITIIVIIILAVSVILSLADSNPIAKANEAKLKTDVKEYVSQLSLVISKKYLDNPLFNPDSLNAGTWDGQSANITGTIKEYIPIIKTEHATKFVIQNSKLVYIGEDLLEQDYLADTNVLIPTSINTVLGVNVIATDNATVNGQVKAYNNPIVPKGFKAVNIGTSWPVDWNSGLVIEDASGNQFVWVPVDGTSVTYSEYNPENNLPGGVSILTQIANYGGFYVGRYESMFDYNGGTLRVAVKKSLNKTTTDWVASRDLAHSGYLWNWINYLDSKKYSEEMAIKYNYDTSKVVTHLLTVSQSTATDVWISENITDFRASANCKNSQTPANVSGFGNLQISGFSEFWKTKNIYDYAGNTWEKVNKRLSDSYFISVGGSYTANLLIDELYAMGSAGDSPWYDISFRVVLYIK